MYFDGSVKIAHHQFGGSYGYAMLSHQRANSSSHAYKLDRRAEQNILMHALGGGAFDVPLNH